LIVKKDDKRIFKNLEELKGKKLGVGQGSNFEEKAKSIPGIDVKSYPGAPEYLQDLASGRLDAALNDSLMISYLLKTSTLPIKAGAPIGELAKSGIPFQKGNPKFQAALNNALAAIIKDGSFGAASNKWFGRDVSKAPTAQ
jgi:cystine transport system substrate-binding protein